MRKILAVAVLLAALAGCSSSAPPTAAQVAGQIGAVVEHPYPRGPFASGAVTARWHGRQVVIAVFASDGMKQDYVRAVSAFQPHPLLSGPGYVVYANQL
jgi:hypothetical protein